jgi:hypothetical protein
MHGWLDVPNAGDEQESFRSQPSATWAKPRALLTRESGDVLMSAFNQERDAFTASHPSMPIRLTDEKRLRLLNESQPDQPWHSCAEKRICIACERTFKGSAATVSDANGTIALLCPNCGSGPRLWVRPGNPLTDDLVWGDWERALEQSAADLLAKDELPESS